MPSPLDDAATVQPWHPIHLRPAPTAPATSRNVKAPPHFTSPASAGTVRCGWCTTPSRRAGSSPRPRRCPTAVRTWLARTTDEGVGYLAPHKSFAIGLGCDIAHAHKLISHRHRSDRRPHHRPDRRRLQGMRPPRLPTTRLPATRSPYPHRRRHIRLDPLPPGTGLITSCTRVADLRDARSYLASPSGIKMFGRDARTKEPGPPSDPQGRSDHTSDPEAEATTS